MIFVMKNKNVSIQWHQSESGLIKRGAIVHTDRGSQYAAVEYRRLLYIGGFRQSMSRRGNCYDNAQADAFLFPRQSGIS